MRKNKLIKRLRGLGFEDSTISMFNVLRDYFGIEPVVVVNQGRVFSYFMCYEWVPPAMSFSEGSVRDLEYTMVEKIKSGFFLIKDSGETIKIPPSSNAKELKMKLSLCGYVKRY